MQIEENAEEIRIRHVPVRDWIVGGVLSVLTLVFFFLFLSALIFSAEFHRLLFGEWIDAIFYASLAASAILMACGIKPLIAPLTTVSVDHQTLAVTINEKRFYGTKTQRLYFHQIDKFKSYKGKLNFSPQYFLALVLANRKTLRLKIPVGTDKLETTRLVKKLNKFVKSKKSANESV